MNTTEIKSLIDRLPPAMGATRMEQLARIEARLIKRFTNAKTQKEWNKYRENLAVIQYAMMLESSHDKSPGIGD